MQPRFLTGFAALFCVAIRLQLFGACVCAHWSSVLRHQHCHTHTHHKRHGREVCLLTGSACTRQRGVEGLSAFWCWRKGHAAANGHAQLIRQQLCNLYGMLGDRDHNALRRLFTLPFSVQKNETHSNPRQNHPHLTLRCTQPTTHNPQIQLTSQLTIHLQHIIHF